MTQPSSQPPKSKPAADPKQDKLAKALRENLLRRKATAKEKGGQP